MILFIAPAAATSTRTWTTIAPSQKTTQHSPESIPSSLLPPPTVIVSEEPPTVALPPTYKPKLRLPPQSKPVDRVNRTHPEPSYETKTLGCIEDHPHAHLWDVQ